MLRSNPTRPPRPTRPKPTKPTNQTMHNYHVILYSQDHFTHRSFATYREAERHQSTRDYNIEEALGIMDTSQGPGTFTPAPDLPKESRQELAQSAKFYWACVIPGTDPPLRCERRPIGEEAWRPCKYEELIGDLNSGGSLRIKLQSIRASSGAYNVGPYDVGSTPHAEYRVIHADEVDY